MEINMHLAGYSGARAAAFEQRVVDAVGAIPGVEAAGWSDPLPLGDSEIANVYRDNARDFAAAHAAARTYEFRTSPDYLRADGTRLMVGRSFSPRDDKDAPRVAVVNRRFVSTMFGSEKQAVGQQLHGAGWDARRGSGDRGGRNVQDRWGNPKKLVLLAHIEFSFVLFVLAQSHLR